MKLLVKFLWNNNGNHLSCWVILFLLCCDVCYVSVYVSVASRGLNNALLDTYQLKSLDAVLEAKLDDVEIVRNGSKLYLKSASHRNDIFEQDNFAVREPYDRIIRCLGFKFNDTLFSRLLLPQSFYTVKHFYCSQQPLLMYLRILIWFYADLITFLEKFLYSVSWKTLSIETKTRPRHLSAKTETKAEIVWYQDSMKPGHKFQMFSPRLRHFRLKSS